MQDLKNKIVIKKFVKKILKQAKIKTANKKTKAILISAIALVLCLATVLTVVLIQNSIHPLERFAAKIARKQNFEMEVYVSDIPLFGTISFVCEVDGNVQHICDSSFVSETYIEVVDGVQYQYSKNDNGKWVKEVSEESLLDNITTSETLQQLINVDNYEEVEGQKNVYRQKSDVVFNGCKDVTISFDKKSCIIEMVSLSYGMELRTLIIISNVGNVDIQLPTVG